MKSTANYSYRKGAIELLILSVLAGGDYYGYEISQIILKRGDGKIEIPEGSMYPTLYRLEDRGLISSTKELVGKRMTRVYYHLENKGREYFYSSKADYYEFNEYVRKILEYDSTSTGKDN
jgi:PadR family transcriptional regulator